MRPNIVKIPKLTPMVRLETAPTIMGHDQAIAPTGMLLKTKPNHLNLQYHVDLCHHVKPPSDHASEFPQT